MRNERGITLIALVITIVILIILAGVTITYALSENGIFSRAKEAGTTSQLGALRDDMLLAKMDAMAAYYEDTTKTLEPADALRIVKNNFSGFNFDEATHSLTITAGKLEGTITVKLDAGNYTVDFTNNKVLKAE